MKGARFPPHISVVVITNDKSIIVFLFFYCGFARGPDPSESDKRTRLVADPPVLRGFCSFALG